MDEYWGTGRTEAFSDGVLAIANTRLILEVSVPESAFDDLWSGNLLVGAEQRLRRKLAQHGQDVIHTQRGIGYSLRLPRTGEGANGADA